ncbi:hypothetical protein YC2023_015645 [Brassica napus]
MSCLTCSKTHNFTLEDNHSLLTKNQELDARVNLTSPDLVNSGVSPYIPQGSYVDLPKIAKKISFSTVLSLDL